MPNEEKPSPGLTIDKAAFLLLRVKRAFKKKKQQRKEKNLAGGECLTDVKSTSRQLANNGHGNSCYRPPPLLRSRTLPAIVVPGISILQKQIDARLVATDTTQFGDNTQQAEAPVSGDINAPNSSINNNSKFLTPRILFTDDALERRVSESMVDSRYKAVRCGDIGKSGYKMSSGSILCGSQPLTKLVKLLNQRTNYNTDNEISHKILLEKRSGNSTSYRSVDATLLPFSVPRSTSIDSINTWGDWNIILSNRKNTLTIDDLPIYNVKREHEFDIRTEPCSPALLRRSPSPSQTPVSIQTLTPLLKGRNNERHSFVSGNISKRIKGHRSNTEFQSLQKMEFLEGFGKRKNHQPQQQHSQEDNHLLAWAINPLTAQTSLNVHLHALFTAIEYGHLDKVKTILETTDVDVNSLNSDGLSPLDIAVLYNNSPLIKILIAHGAQEGNHFKSAENLNSHLRSLILSAEHKLAEVGGSRSLGTNILSFLETTSTRASFSTAHNNLTGCGGNTEDKQVALWERRVRSLKKIMLGFDQARPPDVPCIVSVDVIGIKSVNIKFETDESSECFPCTKFRVQWSTNEDFSVISGEKEVFDMMQKDCKIDGLVHGQRYFFRTCSGNLRGYSKFVPSIPPCVTPSSWRDIDGRLPRFAGRLEQLDSLFIDIHRPEYAQDTPALQRRNQKKKTTIKQLFTATSKFQKNLRRGVYLACLLYHEDKILVTNEDFLPVIEVDETYPSCIYNDFHWLMKIACTWDNVKTLRQDMEKSHGSSMNHFRLKLLQAAAQMQTALSIQDLGQIYHKPIRDTQGILVISTVNYIKSPKLVSLLNSRWLPLNKVIKKLVIQEDSNVAEILMANIQDQINYHKLSSISLNKGLFLGYLKMQSSVDLIQVVVPSKAPNVLPHCKIRDNPHIAAEEWDYLKKITRFHASSNNFNQDCNEEEKENTSNEIQGSEQAKLFIESVANASHRLFSYMNVNAEDSQNHRLYDAEVIELTKDVSFLIVVPPVETVCLVPGTREILFQREDLLTLPIQVFEMVHLNAYQKDVINCYSRLSCILELDTAQAQQNHREAFSSSEVTVTKDKLTKLQDLQSQVNNVWKGARWLIDVITFARDRSSCQNNSTGTTGICMKYLLGIVQHYRNNGHSLKRSLLQLPPRDSKVVKSSPSRGSWPGPNVTNSTTNLLRESEFSKSEQQLTSGDCNTTENSCNTSDCHLSVVNDCKRNRSDLSNFSTDSDNLASSDVETVPKLPIKLPPSRSENSLFFGQYRKLENDSKTHQLPLGKQSTSISASTSHLGIKQNANTGSSGIVSMSESTNTTRLLNTISSSADRIHIVNNENYYTVPCSSTTVKTFNTHHAKTKLNNPTATVASIASTFVDNINDFKGRTVSGTIPGILQVYAAYETGLAAGTSLKLHVTPRTTAREVVDLVVRQLNMAIVLKGQDGPIYSPEELSNFCLVAVIGARERCLRDDFKPLQLQNPWKKGRLYVRLKQDVLAALEHSSKHTAYL